MKATKQYVLLLIIAVMFAAGGCVKAEQEVGVFAKAASEVMDKAGKGYDLMDETSLQADKYALATLPDIKLTESSLESPFSRDPAFVVRRQTLKAMKDYADALGVLATADYAQELDAATAKLYGTTASLAKRYAKDFDTDGLKIFATAIKGVGSLIIENKRFEALKKIVSATDPIIQSTCTNFALESKDIHAVVYKNLLYIKDSSIKKYNTTSKSIPIKERIILLETIESIIKQNSNAKLFFEELNIAFKRTATAHNDLKQYLNNNSTLENVVESIVHLGESAESMNTFYNKLQ